MAGEAHAQAGTATGPSGTLMAALAWIPRLVALHIAWVLLVLAGAVVGGIAPATATLVAALRRQDEFAAADGTRQQVRGIWRRYRRELLPANRAAGPFVVIALAAGLNVVLGVAGSLPPWFFPAGFAASAVLLVLGVLAAAHAVALHVLRPSAPGPTIWRGALAGVVLLPVATGSWAITLVAAVLASAVIQPIGLLAGGGILVAVTTFVLVRSWQTRLDHALTAAVR